ncbi:MAG: hypothetical protein M1812_005414 [Candelaria pacifica]|nr:MAG: hypothetical protein M1812_005414 [Candelaria pacifica]
MSASIKPPSDGKPTFQSIATEIRLQILSYLLQTDLIINMGEREPAKEGPPRGRLRKVQRHRRMKLETKILLTCKQLCDEGSFVLYQQNTFFFDSTMAMEKWLIPITARWDEKVPTRYRHDIREVEVGVEIRSWSGCLALIYGTAVSGVCNHQEELSYEQQQLLEHLARAGLTGIRKLTLTLFGGLKLPKEDKSHTIERKYGAPLLKSLRTAGVKANELVVKGCQEEGLIEELKTLVESKTEESPRPKRQLRIGAFGYFVDGHLV